MNSILDDLRFGACSLLRTPRFTVLAALTLALGIGVNVAIFSILDAVLFRPLPFPDAGRLVSLWEINPKGQRFTVAPANLTDYRAASAFESLAGVANIGRNLTGAGPAERLNGLAVTFNYLDVLGVRPARGRMLTQEEDQHGNERVAVISHQLWGSR